MAKLRSHWRTAAVVTVALMSTGTLLWRGATMRTAWGLQGPEPLSLADHGGIIGVLKYVSLDRDALVALNLSNQQAEDVLTTVRNWWDSNKSALETKQQAIWAKERAVRNVQDAITAGPLEEGREAALASALAELATARANYDDTFDGLRTSINNLLSVSQQTTWSAIQSGFGERMPLRMLALTDAQRLDVSKAVQRFRYQRAAAASAQARSAVVSTYESHLEQILTQDQKNVLAAYESNYASASAAVVEAFEAVLALEES